LFLFSFNLHALHFSLWVNPYSFGGTKSPLLFLFLSEIILDLLLLSIY